MLRIRDEQVRVLADIQRQEFVEKMINHLLESFSDHLAAQQVGQSNIEEFVLHGIDESESWGVSARGDIKLYLQCMAEFGAGFDDDPGLDWAFHTLRDASLSGEEKMDAIDSALLLLEIDNS